MVSLPRTRSGGGQKKTENGEDSSSTMIIEPMEIVEMVPKEDLNEAQPQPNGDVNMKSPKVRRKHGHKA